tara:strand:+ start:894 stop:1388 length:495 start_codon:yes stop_codon:yes gene_type:complete
MKKTTLSLFILITFLFNTQAQKKTLPEINVKTLKGKSFNIQSIENDGNPIVINFWATWCKPCKKELNNISELYDDWQDETGVKIIAVSVDDARSMSKVGPYVNSSGWEYEIYLDPNKDLFRSLGGSSMPHTFLLNSKKEIVWEHRGYIDGDEDKLLDAIRDLIK